MNFMNRLKLVLGLCMSQRSPKTELTEFKISCVNIHPGKLWSTVTEIYAFEKMKQQQKLRVEVTQRI